ncbi:MAG TPA: hypothetical protein PKH77_01865 [Anaerolineae bacterium]|nr:hypothetical protein [Anaerolineae bacterium]
MFADFWSVFWKLLGAFVFGPWAIVTFAFVVAMLIPSGGGSSPGGDVTIIVNQK